MRPSTAVARWSWGDEEKTDDWVRTAVRLGVGMLRVLVEHRLAVGPLTVRASVIEAGRPDVSLFRSDIDLTDPIGPPGDEERLVRWIRDGLAPGEPGEITLDITPPGIWLDAEGGPHEEELFTLGSQVIAGYPVAYLAALSDAWMRYDLRGRAQSDVHRRNHPRLASAIADISALLGDELEPDDPTWFGIPTESGIENHMDGPGRATDVWSKFEIPQRRRIFRETFLDADYKRSAEGSVAYAAVGREDVLGYLWASDPEGAASFVPRDAAGEAAYQAGHLWLGRLRGAKGRGLTPTEALAEAASSPPDDPRASRTSPETELAPSLAALWKLANPDG